MDYAYDAENRLIGVTKHRGDATGSYAYVYDYRTRRVERDESLAGGHTAIIVYSGGTSRRELVADETTVAYIRGSDYGGGVGGILYTLRDGEISVTHSNHRGDIVAKTNSSGAVTWQAAYEAFGTRTQETGATSDRQKANSKDEDPSGLLNEGFRYRDLETGTFITRDPAGFVDGPNLYTYVRQNPWTAFDPQGLNDEDSNDPPPPPPKREKADSVDANAAGSDLQTDPTYHDLHPDEPFNYRDTVEPDDSSRKTWEKLKEHGLEVQVVTEQIREDIANWYTASEMLSRTDITFEGDIDLIRDVGLGVLVNPTGKVPNNNYDKPMVGLRVDAEGGLSLTPSQPRHAREYGPFLDGNGNPTGTTGFRAWHNDGIDYRSGGNVRTTGVGVQWIDKNYNRTSPQPQAGGTAEIAVRLRTGYDKSSNTLEFTTFARKINIRNSDK